MKTLEALDRLLDLAIEENNIEDIGTRIAHSKEYETNRATVEGALTRLETIERQCRVQLDKIFDAIAHGFYYLCYRQGETSIEYCEKPLLVKSNMTGNPYAFNLLTPNGSLWVEDYGDTWALTKEELNTHYLIIPYWLL